jgi:hypothetical protein
MHPLKGNLGGSDAVQTTNNEGELDVVIRVTEQPLVCLKCFNPITSNPVLLGHESGFHESPATTWFDQHRGAISGRATSWGLFHTKCAYVVHPWRVYHWPGSGIRILYTDLCGSLDSPPTIFSMEPDALLASLPEQLDKRNPPSRIRDSFLVCNRIPVELVSTVLNKQLDNITVQDIAGEADGIVEVLEVVP